ncbi:MAG: DUF4097 family beta strand repeat-containing protein [Aeromicrobium sp.]|uniref:DUF4097 family beta strand repeat-containing protein n=1 Tax=Aeromicrobium sp. TaxID=1871063 RepID=UPI003C5A5F79
MKRRAEPVETVADYDVRSPAVRTVITVASTLVAVSALAAMVLGASILTRDTRVATSQVDLGEVAQLVVTATDADIRIVEGDPDLLTITSSITSGLRKTDYQVGRRDDEIKIVSVCQAWLNPGCGVATTLQVPPGLPLVIRTTDGNVRAVSISKGVLTVSTTSGDVKATGLGVDEFQVETAMGGIEADFATQPFGFKATTSSGNVRAMIPSGDRSYGVTTKTGSGQVRSQLTSDSDGDGFVRVTTGSGDITLTTS